MEYSAERIGAHADLTSVIQAFVPRDPNRPVVDHAFRREFLVGPVPEAEAKEYLCDPKAAPPPDTAYYGVIFTFRVEGGGTLGLLWVREGGPLEDRVLSTAGAVRKPGDANTTTRECDGRFSGVFPHRDRGRRRAGRVRDRCPGRGKLGMVDCVPRSLGDEDLDCGRRPRSDAHAAPVDQRRPDGPVLPAGRSRSQTGGPGRRARLAAPGGAADRCGDWRNDRARR